MLKARWLSPPIEELHGRKVFTACQTNSGECISTGDFVHLLPADSCMELYVGRIESMYEDESSLKCIQVRWFYRPRDLQHDPPLPSLECEVYHTSYYDCQLIESVVGRCTVMHKRDYLRMKGRKSSLQALHDQQHIYVCSFSYSIEAGLFIAIQEEVLAGSAPNLPYLAANDNANREISHEDIAVAKQLANALLSIDRGVPRQVARADWSTSKRLPWVLKAKNAMTLEDLKQLLIDLESGLEVFKHENGWRKSVQDIASFDTLNNHIQYLKQNAQQKVDEAFKKPPSKSHPEKQTSKRKALRTPRPDQYKWRTVKIGSQLEIEGASKKIGSGCAYEMDNTCPSPNSPIDLKCLRVMVGATPSYRRLPDATPSYRRLSDEKQLVEEPLAEDLWRSVEVMQDDVAMVLDSMGFSQAVLPLPPCEPAPKNLLELTEKTSVEDDTDQNSKENILLFQRAAAQVSSSTGTGLADPVSNELLSTHPTTQMVINAPAIPCLPSTEKQIISPKEEQDGGCGFRVWKPEGSFVARKLGCFQRECLA